MLSESSGRDRRSIRTLRLHLECPENLLLAERAAREIEELIAPIEIDMRTAPIAPAPRVDERILEELVSIRRVSATDPSARPADSFALREFERRALNGMSRARGVPYEGERLRRLYQRLLDDCLDPPAAVDVVITDRLPLTWSSEELRYHARVAVFGLPSVLSISGLIEAPARPREYYVARQALSGMGATAEPYLAKEFGGRYLELDDERLPKVLSGYLTQCIFYSHLLWPFCEDRDCMLFNAHWQEELIRAQLESGRLCPRHEEVLEEIREGSEVRWLRNDRSHHREDRAG